MISGLSLMSYVKSIFGLKKIRVLSNTTTRCGIKYLKKDKNYIFLLYEKPASPLLLTYYIPFLRRTQFLLFEKCMLIAEALRALSPLQNCLSPCLSHACAHTLTCMYVWQLW